jgi:hypothetical protein
VFHDLRTDHSIESRILIGQVKSVPLVHDAYGAEFPGSLFESARGRAQRREVEVQSHDAGASLKAAKAMSTFATPGIQDQVLVADVKSIEVDGQKHG